MRENQSGRSMIEMLGVIAIIGILTAGGLAGFSKALDMYRTNRASHQISFILGHVRGLYRGQKSYRGLDSKTSYRVIDRTEIFPKDMGSGGNYRNLFSGPVRVKTSCKDVATVTDGDRILSYCDELAFVLVYGGVPRGTCLDLAKTDWGTGSYGGAVAVGVNVGEDVEAGLEYMDSLTTRRCRKTSNPASSQNLGNAVVCEGDGKMSPMDASRGCSSKQDNTLYFKLY